VYQLNQSAEWLEKLSENANPVCMLLEPSQAGAGLCSQYPYRGLICRLFGFSSRTNKYSRKEFVTCQTIKTEQAAAYAEAVQTIEKGGSIPVMNHYYMRLLAIDPDLGRDFYPVNEAIRRAIETVLHYYAYRS
ncbi:MAG TPA: YkgJ family cysteine cluster protein, partial [Chryseosolibacter sp.]|nr:YkgJ family cysteine cluster protein [Chryseosolibacter sp.]